MQVKSYNLENIEEWRHSIKAGELIYLNGWCLAFRDQAHKRLTELFRQGAELPIDLKNRAVYYVGPTPPTPSGRVLAAGPTTSKRMAPYIPLILEMGVRLIIGKGELPSETRNVLRRYDALYLVAPGGAAAYLAEHIAKIKVIAFEELGPEAIFEMQFVEFPVVVAYDALGNDAFLNREKRGL